MGIWSRRLERAVCRRSLLLGVGRIDLNRKRASLVLHLPKQQSRTIGMLKKRNPKSQGMLTPPIPVRDCGMKRTSALSACGTPMLRRRTSRNSRGPAPQVVLGSNSGSLGQTQVSQLTSNAPRTILKRPSAAPSTSSSSSAAAQKSIQEREASYQAARDRIFGNGPAEAEGSDASQPKSTIIRIPRGPEASPNEPTPKAGFAGRVRKQGHGRTISDLEGIKEAIKNSGPVS